VMLAAGFDDRWRGRKITNPWFLAAKKKSGRRQLGGVSRRRHREGVCPDSR
jgi:hypothetical protein